MKKEIKFNVLVGISGSGKSTYAFEEYAKRPENVCIINRDNIRNALFGYTDKTCSYHYSLNTKEFNRREKLVTKQVNLMIKDAILGSNNIDTIIIDNTNITPKYIKEFEYYNIPIQFTVFDIPVGVAKQRNKQRDRQVPDSVIDSQYSKFLKILKFIDEYNFIPKKKNNLKEDKTNCIVVDIDGTLAHISDRDIYDFSKVNTDILDELVSKVVYGIEKLDIPIIICSGRNIECINETTEWLKSNKIKYEAIYMRSKGDYRADWVVKEEFWEEIEKKYNIIGMIDDRSQVVDRARYLGYKVLQVDYANF